MQTNGRHVCVKEHPEFGGTAGLPTSQNPQKEEAPANQNRSETIYHSANQLSLDAHPVFLNTQEETQLK